MEELREKANCYAEENVVSILKEAIAKSYADGYRDGFKDREEMIPVDLRNNTTEFVDLGLPSGTLWATDYEKENENSLYIPYDEANNFNLPTKEQWEELVTTCNWQIKHKDIYCVGPNGKYLNFTSTGLVIIEKNIDYCDEVFFWIDYKEDSQWKTAARIYVTNKVNPTCCKEFCGYKLPIRQVRIK